MHRFVLAAALLAAPALAADPPRPTHAPIRTDQPRSLGRFEDWQAATHLEAGQTVCYAFTRARSSNPKLAGRGDVVLTVTARPGGRDAVAISAGYGYLPNAEVKVQVDKAEFDFYTAQRSAFARDGHAAVAAFLKAREMVAHGPARHHQTVSDGFSLRGFAAAYAAVNKACPTK